MSIEEKQEGTQPKLDLDRRKILLGSSALVVAAAALNSDAMAQAQKAAPAVATTAPGRKPNILVIWGDDIGMWNLGAY